MNTPDPAKKLAEEMAELRRISDAQHAVRTAAHAVCDRIPRSRATEIRQRVSNADISLLAGLRDPREVHLVAVHCDQDARTLLRVVQHSYCDAGTALWLYWDNDPYLCSQLRTVDDVHDEGTKAMVRLSRTVEKRFLRDDFISSRVPFDPRPWVSKEPAGRAGEAHEIPEIMKRPICAR